MREPSLVTAVRHGMAWHAMALYSCVNCEAGKYQHLAKQTACNRCHAMQEPVYARPAPTAPPAQ